MLWNLGPQNLDWVSPSRIFATQKELFDSQPNYEHEVAIAQDTKIKYQGFAPVVGGWRYATGAAGPYPFPFDPATPTTNRVALRLVGSEGSIVFQDTNGAGVLRSWDRARNAHITAVNPSPAGGSSLILDGVSAIETSNIADLQPGFHDFAIAGAFLCNFPSGETRPLLGMKGPGGLEDTVFWMERESTGRLKVGIQRDNGLFFSVLGGTFTDTVNPGWHTFSFERLGSQLRLIVDGGVPNAVFANLGTLKPISSGKFAIGSYGGPGPFSAGNWIGQVDDIVMNLEPPVLSLDPIAINDSFTKLMLQFEGLEQQRTYYDTNAAGWPRTWTQQSGFGHITNVDEARDDGALLLDGQTVITAPDSVDLDFKNDDFTVRGYFKVDFPLGEQRWLVAKTDDATVNFVFGIGRAADGRLFTQIDTRSLDFGLVDRFASQIEDRFGQDIIVRNPIGGPTVVHTLNSTATFGADNTWHTFLLRRRSGTIIEWLIDGAVNDSGVFVGGLNGDYIPPQVGPITIGGLGKIRDDGSFDGTPWKGGLDRFAVDIGIAR